MAQADEQYDVRRELLGTLLDKVHGDRYPSVAMMDLIEELVGPDERSIYAQVLIEKIRRERRPSLPMIRRVVELG
jgi:hypothetical protein